MVNNIKVSAIRNHILSMKKFGRIFILLFILIITFPASPAFAVILHEDFDSSGSSWSNTIFPDSEQTASYEKFDKHPLEVAPNTSPPLPINVAGDCEGRVWLDSAPFACSGYAFTSDEYSGQDMSMEGYIWFGRHTNIGSQTAAFLLRMDGRSGYNVSVDHGYGYTISVSQMRDGGIHSDYPRVQSNLINIDWETNNLRLKATAIGNTISASAWIVSEQNGVIVETPVQLSDSTEDPFSIKLIDSMFSSGIAGIRTFTARDNTLFFDDITINTSAVELSLPVANAGDDQAVIDSDHNGSEQVTLDGSASTGTDDIVSWVWFDDLGDTIPDGEIVTTALSVGVHTIILEVTDSMGETDADIVIITVDQPELISINYDNAQQGESITVTITGQNTNFTQGGTAVWFSHDSSTISASSFSVSSATSLTADFHIPSNSPLGSWDVNVENAADGLLTLFDSFLVLIPTPINQKAGTLLSWGDRVTPNLDFSNITSIAAGRYHNLALKDDRSIVAWGRDQHGQVSKTPTETDFIAIAAGGYHNIALKADGSIVAWGYDYYDEVSDAPTEAGFTAIAAGGGHSLALKADGSIVAWGSEGFGEVSDTPTGTGFITIATGDNHCLAIRTDGSIVAWGDDRLGEVSSTPTDTGYIAITASDRHSLALKADGSIVAWGYDYNGTVSWTPTDTGFIDIAAGHSFNHGLKADGSIVTWGGGSHGHRFSNTPGDAGFIAIATGHVHSLALKADGSIVASGSNSYGQVSYTHSEADFIAIAAGPKHSLGLKTDGSIVGWGFNNLGQASGMSDDLNFIAIAAGAEHSLGLKADGSITAWGSNSYGLVSNAPSDTDFIAIAAGNGHSLALKTDGSLIAWGGEMNGKISNTPTDPNFIAIAAGSHHNLALRADGSIVAWGNNTYGVVSTTPTDSGYVDIVAGAYHSLALRADGSIVAWGSDGQGRVSDTPTETGFIAIAAGDRHSLALKADGSIFAWGNDDYDKVSQSPADTGFIDIAAGGDYSLAIQYVPITIYVDGSAVGNNDGSSWADAFNNLYDALGVAVWGNEIRVADGRYLPDTAGPAHAREASFALVNGVAVRGGYAGYGTTDPDERDIELYETILSGDLNGDDVEFSNPVDFWSVPNRSDNSESVVTSNDCDETSVLDGFTITAGSNSQNGAGMCNSNSSPTVTNCTFKWNCAEWGAGMANWNSSPKVTGCKFENNAAGGGGGMNNMENSNPILIDCTFSNNFGSWMGGGMVNGYAGLLGSANPTLINCTFNGNSSDNGGGMYNRLSSPTVANCTFSGNLGGQCGGGMYNEEESNPTVTYCIFLDNTAEYGGGMYNKLDSSPTVTNSTFNDNSAEGGGGMYNSLSSPTVANCTFSGNSAHQGGGMNNYFSVPIITNCTFSGNSANYSGGGMHNTSSSPTVADCIFIGNSAVSEGGGMSNMRCSPTVVNCTFSSNSADSGGGMYSNRFSSIPVVSNCILWGNTAISGNNEIYGDPVISYSDIEGSGGSGGGWDASLGTDGGGNIDVDPMFVRNPDDGGDGWGDDPATGGVDEGANDDHGDLRLQSGSLCIDAGDNGAVTEAIDLDGRIRIVDGDGDGTVTVDMGAYEAQVIYVDRDAVGANNGGSWGDAFNDLYDALGVAVWGYEIRVAGGTYLPDTAGLGDAREASFALVNGVTVKGGYAGFGAASPDERDIELYETILSGDLLGDDDSVMLFGDLFTPQYIDPNRAENCYHVFYHPDGLGLDPNAVLDGFTITGGNAIGASFSQYSYGGGMCNESGSPTVTNCIFRSNLARDGAGIYNGNSSPTVKNCLFSDNLGLGVAGEGGLGGGMYNYNNSNPTVSDSIFSGNSAGWLGGGMCNYDSSPTVTGCIFSGNSAGWFGGGMCNGIGSPTVMNCVFIGNTADYGGGMFNEGSSPILTNCTLSYNQASQGGGIFNRHHESWGTVTRSFVSLFNCILWGNTASTEGNEIAVIDSSTITVNYCDVEGDEAGIYDDGSGNTINWGSGNIDVDPMFVDADSGYLRLLPGSLCIDAGDNLAVTEATDLDGHTRVADGDCDGAAVVDMGAYEFDWLYLGDFAGGCDVDLSDFAVLAENWQGSNAGVDIAPYHEGDGVIDLGELMVLAEHWLECYTPPEPLDVSLDIDGSWMYQNLPGKVASNLTAAVSVTGDSSGNSSYSYEWEIISPSDVTIEPVTVSGGGSSDELWTFAAGGCDEAGSASDSGQVFIVKVTVVGDDFGNVGSAEVEFGIALLGDVNNDTVVNGADRGIINTFWIDGSAGNFGLGDCDVNCDGVVNGADRGITNTVWGGTLGSNSITNPCPLR